MKQVATVCCTVQLSRSFPTLLPALDGILLEAEEDDMENSYKAKTDKSTVTRKIISLLEFIMTEPRAKRFATMEEDVENVKVLVPKVNWLSLFDSYLEAMT